MADYRTIITTVGQTKLAAAILGPAIVLEKMAIGDASDVGYDPDEAQLALVNQLYIADLDSVETLAGGVIVCELTIPADQGGWHVREACIKDDDGDIIAICRIADRYKPLPASGQADELTIRMKLDVGNVGNVTWAVDLTRKAKIDGQLHPDYRSAGAILNAPPAADAGETWVVGATPTGAWVGHENDLAEWSGSGWTFAAPTPWMHVGLADRTDWRWDHTLGAPAWVQWKPGAVPATVRTPVSVDDMKSVIAGEASVDSDTVTYLNVFPTILAANNKAAVTNAGGGQIALTAFDWSWRQFKKLSVAGQNFATLANKTYHLRVDYNPVTGTQTVSLKSLADVAYNPSVLPEPNDTFSGTYDSLLLARVITDGANTPTIKTLKNAALLFGSGAKTSRQRGTSWSALEAAGWRLDLTLDWARRPRPSVKAASCDAENDLEAMTSFYVYNVTRYGLSGFTEGYMINTGTWSPNQYVSGSIEVEASA